MSDWVIAGKDAGAIPEIGKVYEIRDKRKGTFVGRVLSVTDVFARVEVISGEIKWLSMGNKLLNPNPETVSIRDVLCYLVEIENE
jgi:hypothetical protein